ncbi:hypothetical protein RB195_006015 [Necator americanus]|uniref:Uncharacterized protein n=1 Tax=Necator americanus TaxID=51031 RepID=A0ABR1BUF6_NECAM
MLKFRIASREYNNIVCVLEIGQGASCQDDIDRALINCSSHNVEMSAKLNRKGPAPAPCLTPVTTSNGDVHPAGVRTAAVVR